MKRLLLCTIISMLSLSIFVSAQTKTWIGTSGSDFSNASNWNPYGVPGQNDDVIIPSGSNVIVLYGMADIKSFTLQGNAILNMLYHITFTQPSSIAADATLNWTEGILFGSGTLINNGTINLEGNVGKAIGNSVTIENNGTINFNSTESLSLGFGSPTLNNSSTGVVNLNTNSSITFQQGIGTFINSGLINRTTDSGVFTIDAYFQNNDGNISVATGTLLLNSGNAMLTDGSYNVNTGAALEFNYSLTCKGTLSGQLDGPINWTGNIHLVSGTAATFDFDGTAGVNWYTGSLVDDGTLNNAGILNLERNISKAISNQTTLNNTGFFNLNGTGALTLGYGNPTLNNLATGVINLNAETSISGASGYGNITNIGIIKKDSGAGTFSIENPVTNTLPGKIIAETGLLKFTGAFDGNGMITGNGSIQLADNTLYEGTIAPGGAPAGSLCSKIVYFCIKRR